MDQFMVDLGPDGSAWNEDEVILIGEQGGHTIRCEDVAAAAGTIPYEILVNLNLRIPRESTHRGPLSTANRRRVARARIGRHPDRSLGRTRWRSARSCGRSRCRAWTPRGCAWNGRPT
jgi:hypothetical protein